MRLLLAALLLVHGAAMGQTFACQYVASGGLNREKGRWESTRFKVEQPFFLKITSGQMDKDSVEKTFTPESPDNLRSAALGIPSAVNCSKERVADPTKSAGTDPSRWIEQHTCSEYGNVVIFRPAWRMGTVANLSGGLSGPIGQYRDSVSVSPFTCQQM